MKIAIYHNLPSGGAKRTLLEAVRHLSSRHDFDVYSTSLANQEYADVRPYVKANKVYPYAVGNLYNSPFGRLNMLVRVADLNRIQKLNRSIAAELEQLDYDAIFVNPCQIEISPSILRFTQSVPTLYYCHEPPRILYENMPYRPYDGKSKRRQLVDSVDPLPGRYFSRLKENDRTNTQNADIVLANSAFAQATVKNVYAKQPEVAYPGTDAALFHPLGLERERAVLSVGSLTPLKNFDFIIRALGTISPNNRPPLWLVSNFQNPPEREYLEGLAAQLGVEVLFFGNISDQELVKFYNQAAVTAYTPVREPFGLVPLESMACETPVVTVREGGMQETVQDGVTGWLVDRQPEMLAEKILYVLDNPEIAAQVGKNGRQNVLDHWTWELVTARLEEYFFIATKRN